ncbi:MAG TPA: T9SS type A sorting domain-containing protein [Bacteroidales bacterium]|nr:T9SS type A sorting domain-containing protein [Bacteroidales bacterium]
MKRILIVIAVIFGAQISLFAQWQSTGLIDTFAIKTLVVYRDSLYAGTDGAGIFSTSDGGNTWVAKNSGLTNQRINSIAFDTAGTLYAGSKSLLLFTSADSGNTWAAHNAGGTGNSISSITVFGNNIFAGEAGDGVFLSTNSGNSWAEKGLCCASVLSLCADTNGYIYAGTNAQTVYRSVSPFSVWTKMNTGISTNPVRALISSGALLIAGTYGGGIYISNNHGNSWSAANDGLGDLNVISLVDNGQKMFAGTESGGIFISVDQGLSWMPVNDGLTDLNVTALAICGNYLYAGLSNGEVWKRPLAEFTDISELPSKGIFEIFPNPVADKLYIKIFDYTDTTVEIYSLTGQRKYVLEQKSPLSAIEIDDFAHGIYLIKVHNLKGIQTLKFIKN